MDKGETDTQIIFTRLEILLYTTEDVPSVFDLFLIIAKMHISYCKFKYVIPNILGFISRLNRIKTLRGTLQ